MRDKINQVCCLYLYYSDNVCYYANEVVNMSDFNQFFGSNYKNARLVKSVIFYSIESNQMIWNRVLQSLSH